MQQTKFSQLHFVKTAACGGLVRPKREPRRAPVKQETSLETSSNLKGSAGKVDMAEGVRTLRVTGRADRYLAELIGGSGTVRDTNPNCRRPVEANRVGRK